VLELEGGAAALKRMKFWVYHAPLATKRLAIGPLFGGVHSTWKNPGREQPYPACET
jgi:hypothetical protein